MKTITIKQPWASLIVGGVKDIENRTWATKFRGTVLIHASAKPSFHNLTLNLSHDQMDVLVLSGSDLALDSRNEIYPYSAIIGQVNIVDCVINHPSVWAEKSDVIQYSDGSIFIPSGIKPIYNWVLSNPVLFDKPILDVKGKLSFWEYQV